MIKKRIANLFSSSPFLLLLAFLIRLIFSLFLHPPSNYLFSDMLSYQQTAQRIVLGNFSEVNLFYPTGYPLLISFAIKLVGVEKSYPLLATIQSFFATVSLWLIYDLSKRFLQRSYRLLLLSLLIVYYPQIDFVGYLMSETLTLFLISLSAWIAFSHLLTRPKVFILSLLSFITSLIRPNLSLIAIPLLAYVLLSNYRHIRTSFRKIITLAIMGLVSSILITGAVNQFVSGKFSLVSLNGGLNFAQGQCLIGHATDSSGWVFGPPVFMQRGIEKAVTFEKPFLDSHYFYRVGLNCLGENPLRIIAKIFENYYLFFDNTVWPSSDQPVFRLFMKVSHNFFNILVLPGIILALLIRQKHSVSKKLQLLLIPASILVTTTIFYADIRYRIPYDGFFILLALWGYQESFGTNFKSRLE